MKRRTVLTGAIAASLPAIVRGEPSRVLKFITRGDPTILDPVFTTATVTRTYSLMVFDFLFALDAAGTPQPQMLAGYDITDDGRRWTLTLRDGLRWHDGTPVLARDCVASIKRWGARDPYGQALLRATDDLAATDDRSLVFRLKWPFPTLPAALGKSSVTVCAMMPERLAQTPASQQIKEIVGSGPFRFKADEHISGSRSVYERFAGYKPRDGGEVSGLAGPKRVFFDRVEWTAMPDAGTAAAALQAGEVDWWDTPAVDLLPLLRRHGGTTVRVLDPKGQMNMMRLNHLQPPFDNPAIRRAVLAAVNQSDFMQAVAGVDPSLWHAPVGFFCPETPCASGAGMAVFEAPRDPAAGAAAVTQAGYHGERTAILVASDYPNIKAMSDVGADLLTKLGFAVDYQAVDWGTVQQRRMKKDPVQSGGWSVFFTVLDGADLANPAGHLALNSSGDTAWFGWPSDPAIEDLRERWLRETDPARQKAIAAEIQAAAFQSVPYIPLGQNFNPTAYRSNLDGILDGPPLFWNVRRF